MSDDQPPTPINYNLNPQELWSLATLAIAAKRKAYCPYSNFRVGASILVDNDSGDLDSNFFQGSNVEVASTPVGICAERCALAPIVAAMERPAMPRVRALAVSTDIWPPSSPCGMCRQMIREFCELEMNIYMYGRQPDQDYPQDISHEQELEICGEPVVMTLGALLPMSFGPNDMDKRGKKTGYGMGKWPGPARSMGALMMHKVDGESPMCIMAEYTGGCSRYIKEIYAMLGQNTTSSNRVDLEERRV